MMIHFNGGAKGLENNTRTTCKPSGQYSSAANRLAIMLVTNAKAEVTCPKCIAKLGTK